LLYWIVLFSLTYYSYLDFMHNAVYHMLL